MTVKFGNLTKAPGFVKSKILGRFNIANIAVHVVLFLISYQFMYPMLRMLSTCLMSQDDIINPTVNWLPKSWTFGNINVAATVLDLRKTMINSLWFSSLLAACQTLVSALTGYAFARYNFRFKNFWFMMVLISFIIPTPVVLIPQTMMFMTIQENFGVQMIGTAIPQISMSVLGQGIYSAILILIFYNFTKLIPRVLDEAAAIDGASPFQIFYHIILKLSMLTLLVVFLFSFVWNWNETYITSTFLRGNIELLPGRLNMFDSMFRNYGGAGEGATSQSMLNEAYKMSATFISILPLLGMYLLVQKQFIKGIENAGITGE